MDYREREKQNVEAVLAEKGYPPTGQGLRAVVAGDFPPRLKPEHGDTWGNWTFNEAERKLIFSSARQSWSYGIDLERMPSMTQLWLWVNQFVEKSERLRTPEDIGNLILALHDLLSPTWFNEQTNPTKVLREMYGQAAAT
jgi:hypothetical protein